MRCNANTHFSSRSLRSATRAHSRACSAKACFAHPWPPVLGWLQSMAPTKRFCAADDSCLHGARMAIALHQCVPAFAVAGSDPPHVQADFDANFPRKVWRIPKSLWHLPTARGKWPNLALSNAHPLAVCSWRRALHQPLSISNGASRQTQPCGCPTQFAHCRCVRPANFSCAEAPSCHCAWPRRPLCQSGP